MTPGDTAESHPFICRGCHVRYTHPGTCQICGSDIVVEAEWPTDPALAAAAMRGPEPARHEGMAASALIAVALAVSLAWGEVTLWGVVPSGALTLGLLFVPVTSWRGREAGDQLGDQVRDVPFDGHALQDGAARAAAIATTSRNPIGCIGLAVGVVLPLAFVQWSHPPTIVAGAAAIVGFVLAWIRRHLRETEASAGRGVPL
jgi:hypothetical protein